jgi:hypothetical protein
MQLAPEKPERAIALGDPSLLALTTSDAAAHFGFPLESVPSHKLRLSRKEETGSTCEEQAA